MIVSRFPYPLDKGDKLRAYYQLRELSEKFNVTLVALTDSKVGNESLEHVKKYCEKIEIIPLTWFSKISQMTLCLFSNKPFQIGYFFRVKAKNKIKVLIKENDYKSIYNQLIRTSEYTKNTHHIPKTLDYMDALSVGIKRRIDLQPFYKKWLFKIEAKRLVNYEREIFDYFEHSTIISEQDKKLIQHPESQKIVCIPNGIDASYFNFPVIEKDVNLVFTGNMSYPPNIEASKYIAEQILPELPGCNLLISGSSPSNIVKDLANENSAIELTGWVDDIRTSYARGKVFIAPMFIGTGMQNKLLEAMAMGLPCITTPLANDAINATHGKQIFVANTKEEFIKIAQELLNNEALRIEIGNNAKEFVQNNFSWTTSTGKLIELIAQDNAIESRGSLCNTSR